MRRTSCLSFFSFVYLLYLDESGNEDDPSDRHFVLAGAAVFERQTYFLSNSLEQIQTRHFPGLPPIEFHTSPIRKGKDFWRNIPVEKRKEILSDLVSAISNSNPQGVVLFAAVIEKTSSLYGERAVEHATEQILRRFDLYLARHASNENPQKGMLIFSEGRFDKRAKVWVKGFRQLGTRWGTLRHLCDIPYFASVRETRLLQVADVVAHSVFLLYERRDPSLIAPFVHRFDQKDGTLHGLVHFRASTASPCNCSACGSRVTPHRWSDWITPSALRTTTTNE